MNKVELYGRVAQDGIVESTANGYNYMNFAVAQDGIKYNPQTQQNEVKAQYIDCQIKGKYAGAVGNLGKGTEVHIIGELTQDTWQDQQGNNRSKLRVNILKIDVLVKIGGSQQTLESAPKAASTDFADDAPPF
jgi:single-strand DNA-binding protein